uniref:hypothetical protein n=1 Tax=Ensifer adhaerens TaxID=106592 RepID=UPI003F494B64
MLIEDAGGRRAHEDHDRRSEKNADYRLGSAIIELKLLDDEGLAKPERQEKIAALFAANQPHRPVVIIDPGALTRDERREYTKIMQGPIQGAVRSARKQLKQSRSENPEIETSILFVINNGFSALSHDELKEHTIRRAKNDTDQIDGVVVAGCYLHGDGFDTIALWPIDYEVINPDRPFLEFERLRRAWQKLADSHMTDFVQGEHGADAPKKAQQDIVFDVGGLTFVKPAARLGAKSKFYVNGRPRLNEVSLDDVKHVAVTVPAMSPDEYRRVRAAFPDEPLLHSYESWQTHVQEAMAGDVPLQPVIPVHVTRGGLEAWKRRHPDISGIHCIRLLANEHFCRKTSALILGAQEVKAPPTGSKPYVLVITEVIGQDETNDLSHIAIVHGGREATPIARNERLPFAHALSLGAAHAFKNGVSQVFWSKDLKYAWT